ncbi:putative C2 domain, phosphoribosyltransferase, C2 domain superfamily [Helianthus annuus]|nr:putative C2 domain, phosphoribosyltransferase, C2 domain superfamily [Helianthus annuus]
MKTKDGRATTDAYCVAMYGTKWVRTRTVIDSFAPKWNEQYTWEVFDPCTVMTIGVFDNFHLQGGDSRIGKVRIRLSTLETDRVYTHSYPLLVLAPSGVKKMGEIHLVLRFTCSSLLNILHMYSQPCLPKMHYNHPLTFTQSNHMRHHAQQIVSMRLSQIEPPLRKENVDYMLIGVSTMWNLDELDEEFDSYPTSLRGDDIIRMRYDHIRSISGRIQFLVGDLAILGEKLQSLLSWRDPRGTLIFVIICLIASIVLKAIPFYAVAIHTVLYVSKLLRSKNKLPSVPSNFFKRLPSRMDQML